MPFCPNCGHKVDVTARFCENCGQILPVLNISSMPPPPPTVVEMKARHRSLKIIIFFVVIVFITVMLFGILTPAPQQFVTKPLSDMLPERDDLSTEWIMKNATTVSISATGFIEGIKLDIVKPGLGAEAATINIYRFDSSDNARVYFDGVISGLKAKGGYKEVATKLGDKSYGAFLQFLMGEITRIYVIRLNIFYDVRLAGYLSIETREDAIYIAKIIDRKI